MKAFGFIGSSGSGKTTLAEKVIAGLAARGYRVSAIKNSHHGVDVDTPGKDTWRFRQAGAHQVILSTAQRWALMTELDEEGPEDLDALIARLDNVDIVIVEGFKGRGGVPRIEVRRSGASKPALWPSDPLVKAVATDSEGAEALRREGCALPLVDVNDPAAVVAFIENYLGLSHADLQGSV